MLSLLPFLVRRKHERRAHRSSGFSWRKGDSIGLVAELLESRNLLSGNVQKIDVDRGEQGTVLNRSSFAEIDGQLVFQTDKSELYVTNGSEEGTTLLDPASDLAMKWKSGNFGAGVLVEGIRFFTKGSELWKSDGTDAGTVLVKTVSSFGYPTMATANGKLFFQAIDAEHGMELWTSDGTEAGTVMVKDVFPGLYSGGSNLPMVSYRDRLYFAANDGQRGRELWVSDGTESGTQLVVDLNPGSADSDPSQMVVLQDKLYFRANDGTHGVELWQSDGDSSGTKMLVDLNPGPGGAYPDHVGLFGNLIAFQADNGTQGLSLWMSDGSASGTRMVKDIQPGLGASEPPNFFISNSTLAAGGQFYFAADDGQHGLELWKSDGTEAGTQLLKDTNVVAGSSFPSLLYNWNGLTFFTAYDPFIGRELWVTDGTEIGTRLVKNINLETWGSTFREFAEWNGKLYFTADNCPGCVDKEVFVSDGTQAGTTRLKNINPNWIGSPGIDFSSYPTNLTVLGDELLFFADDTIHGPELWKSDGTEGGTVLVTDANPSEGIRYLNETTTTRTMNGFMYFAGDDATHGKELWRTDGTEQGTTMVADIASDALPYGSQPRGMELALGHLFFFADSESGTALWKSDGTAAGHNESERCPFASLRL